MVITLCTTTMGLLLSSSTVKVVSVLRIIRTLYAIVSYIMFFFLMYSLLLNAVSLIIPVFTGKPFTVDYWELAFIPLIIGIEARYFRPVYPRALKK